MRLKPLYLGPIALLAAAAAQAGELADRHRDDARYAAFDAAIEATQAAMMADPEHAFGKSQQALARARALPPSTDATLALATARWLEAESLIRVNKLDPAIPIIAAALAAVERAGPDTKLHGDLIRSRGAVAAAQGHVQQALTDYQAAFRIFQAAGIERSQAMMLQDIGQIYWDAQDYARVLSYYAQAADVYRGDPAIELGNRNNMGEVLRKLRRFGEAEREYRAALVLARKLDSPLLEVRILSNLAIAQVENGHAAAAEATVARALRLAQSGEAAGWKPFVLGAGAKAAAARGETDRAAALLNGMFADVDLAKTDLSYAEFHQLAAGVFERRGDRAAALAHLKAFQRLDGEARDLVTKTSSQLLAARFDFANQNLKIERQRSEFRTWLLSGLIAAGWIIFSILLVLYLAIRRSRNRLARSNTALEKALAAKTEFLATTSHEIRTPLNGILGMTQVMLTNRSIAPGVIDQIQVVHRAGEAMRGLVDDILDVAKMESGELETRAERIELPALLGDAVDLWRGHAEAKGVALTLDIADAPPAISSDPDRLRQIVSNLLSNAVKFTAEGSVTLRCAAMAAEGQEQLQISVVDTGIGIAAGHHAAIFEPFHQVDGGMNRQFAGTGLGLAISRNLARALGGDITVASGLGAGATFAVRLPLTRLAAEPVRARPQTLAETRLLVVEANRLAQSMLRAVIEPHVAALTFVDDGTAARLALRQADHIVIEGRAAARDGMPLLDALRELVAEAAQSELRTTVLFVPADELTAEAAAGLGADQLIVKPIATAQLVAALRESYQPAEAIEPSARAVAG